LAGVAPYASYHLVSVEDDGKGEEHPAVKDCGMRINGGYFVLRPEIFEWMRVGEELVQEPFQRLAAAGKLLSYSYDGFWACMDTFKDSSCSRTSTRAARCRGKCGRTTNRRPGRAEHAEGLPVFPGRGRGGCSFSGRTATTSRSAAAGRCYGWPASAPTRGVLGDLQLHARSCQGGPRVRGGAFLQGVARSQVIVRDHRDGYLPHSGARGEGRIRGPQARVLARPDLHPLPARSAPGPPVRLRADLEHWAQPLDLEYEIRSMTATWARPNFSRRYRRPTWERKIALLLEHFRSARRRTGGPGADRAGSG